jgi:hypothetical protein
VTAYADAYVLTVDGYGDASGLYGFATSTPVSTPAGVGTVYAGTLRDVPGTITQQWSPPDAVGSDAGLTVSVTHTTDTARLVRRRLTYWADSAGVPLRLSEPVQSSDTTITLTGTISGASSGDLLYVAGEAWSYTSHSGADVTVTRAQLGTTAAPIAWTAPGPVVLSEPPGVVGRRCTVYRVTSAGVSTLYRGTVQGLTTSAGAIGLTIGSAYGDALRRPYAPPEATGLRLPVTLTPGTLSADVEVDTRAWGVDDAGTLWTWCDVRAGGTDYALLVAGAVSSGTLTIGSPPVRAAYDGDEYVGALDLPTGPAELRAVRVADVWSATSPGDVVASIIEDTSPATMRGACAETVQDADAVTLASGVATMRSRTEASDLYYLPHDTDARTIGDVIEALLQPVALSIVPDAQGRPLVIDWPDVSRTATTIAESQVRREAVTGWSQSSAGTLRSALVEGEQATDRVVSDVAAQINGGAEDVEIDSTPWGSRHAECVDRWRQALASAQLPRVAVQMDVARALSVDVGDVVAVTLSTIYDTDGTRGVTGARGLVVERGDTLDAQALTVHIDAGTYQPGAWAPTAEITAWSSPTATVDVSDYDATGDATVYQVGAGVTLRDSTGTVRDTGTVSAVTATTVSITGLTATPAVGDLLTLGTWDGVGSAYRAGYAWLARDLSGTLGAGGDDPFTWG